MQNVTMQHNNENMLLPFSFGLLSTDSGDVGDEYGKRYHHKISTMRKCHQKKHNVNTAGSSKRSAQAPGTVCTFWRSKKSLSMKL
jgi:hypothetical protein